MEARTEFSTEQTLFFIEENKIKEGKPDIARIEITKDGSCSIFYIFPGEENEEDIEKPEEEVFENEKMLVEYYKEERRNLQFVKKMNSIQDKI